MEDSFLHKGLREKLTREVKEKGIRDERILKAIGKVPRHLFMDSSFIGFSYKDQAFPIGAGQTISQPYTVAFQTELLEVEKQMKVLEIGTGSGYQTAILLELGARVYTIERQKELYLKSQSLLKKLGYKAHFFYGDGYQGQPSYGPFDRILITAGAPSIPPKLVEQLKPGGRMVIPVGDRSQQKMQLITKDPGNGMRISEHGAFAFVPMVEGKVK